MEGRFEVLHAAAFTPLGAREDELELLDRCWRRTRSGAGQVVLLAGEAGISKSRLVAALQERIEGEPHIGLRHLLAASSGQCTLGSSRSSSEPLVSTAKGRNLPSRIA